MKERIKNFLKRQKRLFIFMAVMFVFWITPRIYSEYATRWCSVEKCHRAAMEDSEYCYIHRYDFDLKYRASENYKRKKEIEEYDKKHGKSGSSSEKFYAGHYTVKKSKQFPYYGSSGGYDSYDSGYEDMYENEDYDEERYENDDDYAEGVDDAMDDMDW